MRFFYVANARMPTERAHGIQIAKMCEAFALAGAEVHLLVPRRKNALTSDVFTAYGVKANFSVEYLPTIELPFWLPGAFPLQTLTFALAAKRRIEREADAIVYTRGEMILFLVRFLPERFGIFWETHIKPPHATRYTKAAKHAKGIIAITKHYAEEIPSLWNLSPFHVYYAPDGVSLESFANLPTRQDARTRLSLPQDKKIALYAGSDLPWKGLRYLREASALLPSDYLIACVGLVEPGPYPLPNQYFAGTRPHGEVPVWLAAADALVLTGDPSVDTARFYTSPMKLFEYFAVGRPIVAMDLPSFRDVLSEKNALIVVPTAIGLAAGIKEVFEKPESFAAISAQAKEDALQYSWTSRAERILAFIHSCL